MPSFFVYRFRYADPGNNTAAAVIAESESAARELLFRKTGNSDWTKPDRTIWDLVTEVVITAWKKPAVLAAGEG